MQESVHRSIPTVTSLFDLPPLHADLLRRYGRSDITYTGLFYQHGSHFCPPCFLISTIFPKFPPFFFCFATLPQLFPLSTRLPPLSRRVPLIISITGIFPFTLSHCFILRLSFSSSNRTPFTSFISFRPPSSSLISLSIMASSCLPTSSSSSLTEGVSPSEGTPPSQAVSLPTSPLGEIAAQDGELKVGEATSSTPLSSTPTAEKISPPPEGSSDTTMPRELGAVLEEVASLSGSPDAATLSSLSSDLFTPPNLEAASPPFGSPLLDSWDEDWELWVPEAVPPPPSAPSTSSSVTASPTLDLLAPSCFLQRRSARLTSCPSPPLLALPDRALRSSNALAPIPPAPRIAPPSLAPRLPERLLPGQLQTISSSWESPAVVGKSAC